MKMKKYTIISLVVVAIILLALFAGPIVSGKRVDVVHPFRAQAVQAVYATGTVEPTVMLPISPRSSARLIELKVDEGSEVKKGQVLAQLEDDDLQHTIKELEAKEDWAKKEYDRNSVLSKTNAASKRAYDQAQSDYESAVQATNAARAQADYLKLVAPADGLIIKRDGEVGQMLTPSSELFWMSCCAPLRISAEVDEEDIAQVKVGQKVLIRADAFAGQIFNGKVQAITPKGDPVARSYRVRVEFSGDVPLQIGMTAETNIIINEKPDALLVPTSAVKDDKIWLVVDGRTVQKTVKTGIRNNEQTEIVEGVSEDDEVVVKPSDGIKEGGSARPALTSVDKKP